jgi:two-component system response regulator HydG
MTRRVLIVDDDATIRTSLAEALSDDGATTVRTAESADAALGLLSAAAPDVVLSDVRMPGLDGIAFLRLLRERAPSIDVVLMTAYDDMPTVVSAMREGAAEFLVKPLDLPQLRRVIDRVFDDRRSRAAALPRGTTPLALGDLTGRDPKMISIFKLIGQAAATHATVLIRGESGTGKELVARAIHSNSSAAKEPFVPVNCAALPTTLLESELFGHTRGAFTGAVNSRKGRFALAGRGTIFLDEIGDTSPEFQTRLLRVIQDREYEPLGAERSERTEARVIAATHRDLEAMIDEGEFREDLYYRLRVVEVALPPLRDRRDDIPQLAEDLVRRFSAAAGASHQPVLARETIARLLEYDWPGNVRELENCLARAVVVASSGVIRPEHLNMASPRKAVATPIAALNDVERDHVQRVMAATGGHKARAAELLGVSRPRLNRLLEKYGIG